MKVARAKKVAMAAFFLFLIGLNMSQIGLLPSNSITKDFWQTLENGKPNRGKTLPYSKANLLAHQHSFGLFHNISNANWDVLRLKTKTTSWYGNPDDPLKNVGNASYWNRHNMNPNFQCPVLEKMGDKGRGETKFVCNPQRLAYAGKKSGCLIYSVGSAGDFSFEDAIFNLHGRDCEIHVFDTANWERSGDVEKKNIHYHTWGLLSTYDSSKSVVWPKGRKGGFKTFPETLDLLGHRNRTIDVFNIDCEGCKWSTIKDWIGFDIRQILIEMHGVPTPAGTPNARWYQERLNVLDYYQHYIDNGYAIFNKDPNGELSLDLCFIKLHNDFWN